MKCCFGSMSQHGLSSNVGIVFSQQFCLKDVFCLQDLLCLRERIVPVHVWQHQRCVSGLIGARAIIHGEVEVQTDTTVLAAVAG